jgi:hypothetical protein
MEAAMTYQSMRYRSALTGIVLLAGLGIFSSAAFAQGTAPNTDITNQATLNFAVGGVAQTPVASNTTTFKVDRLVRVVVTEVGNAAKTVVPGASAQVTTFSVTNQGNLAQAYLLSGVDTTGGTVTLNSTLYTDNLALSTCTAYVESGGTAGYQAGADTALAITSLAPGASQTVYVVCNIPITATNGQVSVVALVATTAETSGCTSTGAGCVATVASSTAGLDNPAVVDIVFGDAAGSESGDIARDGKHSARDAFVVASATMGVTKTAFLLCDPVNFNVNPRAIPGAYVRYEITIANTGSASATLTSIGDTLNTAVVNFDPDLATATAAACPSTPEGVAGSGFKLTCIGGARGCVTTPKFFTSTSSVDGIDFVTPTITATFATALPAEGTYAAGELKAGESLVMRFNTIIK